ncbi:RluA family pseudouridine synthase [Oceanobacter mangrovi]|uniref:RluA family pseudouridine synthase n=1 Tax=Oceanobacter mangrovi TaxID=2862510 RepID=UPI001C8E755E|nr:RluA family pseudouridine synthase [Oceanobacter mangrovi]
MAKFDIDTSKVNFLEVTEDNHGQRIDNYLLGSLGKVPKALVYRIVRKGEVRVNKKRVKADSRVVTGDIVRVPPLRLPQEQAVGHASDALLDGLRQAIVYEDDALLAINKPHGLAVHGGSGVNLGLIEALRQMYPSHSFLELVHRLDRDTSGIILVAKKRSALVALQKMLVNKVGIQKRYLALVHGRWPAAITEVKAPLKKFERQSGERIMLVDAEGKASHTRYRLLSSGSHYSLLEAEPVTGRTHQIRVHCQYQGHTIAGDDKYRDRTQVMIDQEHGVRRLFLHALQLQFRHPLTGERMSLSAPPGNDFDRFLEKEGCSYEI